MIRYRTCTFTKIVLKQLKVIEKGHKIYSIVKGVCPKCHNEHMYSNPNPYVLPDTLKMNEKCSHCQLKYKMEPSFFFGAMYVSYAVGVAIAVAVFVISSLLFQVSLLTSFCFISAVLFFMLPIILRISRNIWINFFVRYDPSSDKNL